ncbi:MAG: hypothetical protein HRU51_01965 [Xanthomonadales bacterium]|nr:hypothetical protein [Xanthomonadales bacterium]
MNRNRNRLVIVGIFVLFLVPLLAAITLERAGYEPENTVNRGLLVDPPVPLPLAERVLLDGQAAAEQTRGRWTLLHLIRQAGCDAACQARVTELRQVHIAAGRYQNEVQVLLVSETPDEALLSGIYERFLMLANPAAAREPEVALLDTAITAAAARSGAATDNWSALDGTTFIVDPEGNLMLRYAPGYNPSDLNKDLKKLLKWSGR